MATVLVVDDVAANRELVAMLLGYRGHEVVEASDGLAALSLAHDCHPDVVVSDVLMPGIDGLELVHRLRSDTDPGTARAPVIFYTANYLETETRPIAEAYGVSRVVLRNADPKELLDAVDEALRAGPVEVPASPADDFAREHAKAVNAKLVEKARALRQSERLFEAMATASPVGIALLDAEGNAAYVNPRLSEIVRRPAGELAGRGWLCCLEPDSRQEALDAVRDPGAEAVEHRYRIRTYHPDGSSRSLRVHLRPFRDAESDLAGAVVMVDDVTDVIDAENRAAREAQQRQEEARQRDADRLDSLRRMAGGIAHDFNNLLGVMLGFLQLAGESITEEMTAGRLAAPAARALLDDLAQVTNGGERAAKLTEQLLAFGRREINTPALVDVEAYLLRSVDGLARIAGADVRLDLRLAGGAPPVSIDPGALERLLDILLRNAGEAMPAGGTVTIGTAAREPGLALTVADTGTGIEPEVLRRVFEPFFSTKPGSGTAGLGLSTAHGIVTQAGGSIELIPTGEGTKVEIRLPAARQSPAGGSPAVVASAEPPPAGPAGTTVLLVDDDEGLRQVTQRFIANAGYHVLSAADGPAALTLADRHPGPIHCLVTDVVMPGMDGRQLAHRMLNRRPETRIVFVSGFAEALFDDQGRSLEPGRTILAKPYSSEQLTEALRTALAPA